MKVRIYNQTLDPKLWDENLNLNKDVYKSLLKIAQDFYHSTDLRGDIQDILMLGSSVNYNWTPTSDIDLHIVIDIVSEKINPEYTRKFMDSLTSKWNNDHNIFVKNHQIEVYLQDLSEKNHSIGVYSILHNEWIRKPVKERIVLDKKKISKKYNKIKSKIDSIIRGENVEKMKSLLKSISNYRDIGLNKAGEFGTENIVFKALRHTGELRKLKDAIPQVYDKLVSVKEVNQKDIKSHFPPPRNVKFNDDSSLRLDKLTLDNLKSLREKAGRSWEHAKSTNDMVGIDEAMKNFLRYDEEIKKRLKYINKKPFNEIEIKPVKLNVLDYNTFARNFEVDDKKYKITLERMTDPFILYYDGLMSKDEVKKEEQDLVQWLEQVKIYSIIYERMQDDHFTTKLTGDIKYHAIKVISEVLSTIHTFLTGNNADYVYFQADDRRKKLYNVIVNKYAVKYGLERELQNPIGDKPLPDDLFIFKLN
jgi:predicted nucleotidyltransferase